MRIYLGESDKFHGKPAYMYLIELFRKEGLKGATVMRGIAGFGSKSIIHFPSILRLSEDLPIIVEVVDEEQKINNVLDKVKEVVREGLITLEKLDTVIIRRHGES
ncbi:MAG: DUF190 domain-containing protein [Crenarchaeota archaeon]|nr:DUF190 domain-containing protein [Thermoproteota archaeon]